MLGHATVLSAWAPMIAVGLAGVVVGACALSAFRNRTRVTPQAARPGQKAHRRRLTVLAEFVLQRHQQH
jgi:hypothetical protein